MTSQTRFNMNVGRMVRALEKAKFTVADEKSEARGETGYAITKNGECVGMICAFGNGQPYISSFTVYDAGTHKVLVNAEPLTYKMITIHTPRIYTTAAGFIRYGYRPTI